MMDWTGASQKAKYNQHLNRVVVDRAVPDAVPIVRLLRGFISSILYSHFAVTRPSLALVLIFNAPHVHGDQDVRI
jgi:hypothetical protein